MLAALRNVIQEAKTHCEAKRGEDALESLEAALRFRPGQSTKVILWNARDEIKRSQFEAARRYFDGLLRTAVVQTGSGFVKPFAAAVMPVLYYTLRGSVRVKEEGQFNMQSDPGNIQHILFIKCGNPVALALCYQIKPTHGDWTVSYSNVLWLKSEPEK